MVPTNAALYKKLKGCIEDACRDSLSWRPHTTKFKNLVNSILAEEIVCRNIKWWSPDRPLADEAEAWVNHFFEGYQEETQDGLVWNAGAFDRVYCKIEEFLYQDPYESHFLSPLLSFSCDSTAPVELEADVYIREPDERLLYILRNQQMVVYSSSLDNWVVDIVIKQPKPVERQSPDSYANKASGKVRTVLQSLRLLHKGKVFVGPLCYLIYPEFAGVKRNMGALHDTDMAPLPLTHPSYFRIDYQLGEQEVEELKTIYRLMTKESSHYPTHFELALSRFNDYFRRTSEQDGLLDLVIALEALFAGVNQEIGYRLAIRGSYFLEEADIKERSDTFDKLRCIYDIRSSIVHGNPKLGRKLQSKVRKLWGPDDSEAVVSAIHDAADYARRAIRKVIVEKHLGKFREHPEDWQRFLDSVVLKGSD